MRGPDLHPKDHSIQLLTDASNEGWGTHLEQTSTKGLWSDKEKRLHINVLELKAVSLALRSFKDQCQNQTVLVAMDNSTVVAYINKQGGTHSAEMCALLWKIVTWCHHYQITLKARHIPGCLNVSSCRSICHSSEPQTSTVCVSSPRPKCLGHRCSEHKLDGSHCLCLSSDGSPSQGDPKNQAFQLPDHHNSPRLARDALVLGPSAALNRDPSTTSSVNNSSQTVPQLCVSQQSTTSPVTIAALTTIVDRQFKEDRTLCLVRALRYYLDRTKDLRGSQLLLFISFKKGHTSDIRPATLSSWLK